MEKVTVALVVFSTILRVIFYIIRAFILRFVPNSLKKKKNITDQTVLITGAGNGLGRQLAIEFSKYCTSLVLLDINKDGLSHTQKLMNPQAKVFIYKCDVSDRKMVYEVAERVKNDAGVVDILVNNAALVIGKNLVDAPDEKIEKLMHVNVLANFWTCKAFLPCMMERNSGHIVFIASVASFCGGPKLTSYCTSKFATVGFADSLLMELRKQKFDGIHVTTICPSTITTGMFQGIQFRLCKPMTPDQAAKEIVDAVLEGKELVFFPEYMNYVLFWKWVLPTSIKDEALRLAGIPDVMDNFVGRTTDNSVENNHRPFSK